jgi:hypothetical protein
MSNAAPWAATPKQQNREAARSTESPTTELHAERLTALAEARREVDDKLEKIDQQVRSTTVG